ncbi:hypothetical protein CRUP_008098, partial [Coryphaenoides rupestris]
MDSAARKAHLDTLGYRHTAVQVQEKLKKLEQDFKKTKDHNNCSGSGRKTGKWYDLLDSILGHRPAYTASVTKDSSQYHQTTNATPTPVEEEGNAPSTSAVPQSDTMAPCPIYKNERTCKGTSRLGNGECSMWELWTQQARTAEATRRLAALRATNPAIPVMTNWDVEED